jgi:sec-independent protein translocase protein TatC
MKLASLPLIGHLKELRKRIFFSAVACLAGTVLAFALFDPLIHLLTQPIQALFGQADELLYMHSLFEGFITKIKLSLVLGLVLSSPFHVINGLRFLFPGLQKKERWFIGIAVITGFLLAVLGLYAGFYHLLPFSLKILTGSQFVPQKIGVLLNYQQSIFYIFNFLVYLMVAFQFPIVLESLLFLNIVSRKTLLQSTRIVIIIIFLASAMVTPPDVVSQLSLALPLILLFYATLGIAKIFKFGES